MTGPVYVVYEARQKGRKVWFVWNRAQNTKVSEHKSYNDADEVCRELNVTKS
ncbi:hypothetical protein D3C74_242870 [compost metagenome]